MDDSSLFVCVFSVGFKMEEMEPSRVERTLSGVFSTFIFPST